MAAATTLPRTPRATCGPLAPTIRGPRPNELLPPALRQKRHPHACDFVYAMGVEMKGFAMRRILPVLALCLLGVTGESAPASADYIGGGRGGGRNCGFWTYQQCMASVWGNGGYCESNAMYRGPMPGQIPP